AGERVLVVSAGSFGERWAAIAAAYGLEVERIEYAWGEVPAADDVAARLRELGGAKAVMITHSETSTGVVCDLQAIGAAATERGALSLVDAVSSLGAVPVETDVWQLDVVVSGSQKALMTPPGLAAVAVSERAWAARGDAPRFYFDWERTRKAQAALDAPFTPPVSLVAGLDVALGLLLDAGLEAAFDRHLRLGRACREGAKAMGPGGEQEGLAEWCSSPGCDGRSLGRTQGASISVDMGATEDTARGRAARPGGSATVPPNPPRPRVLIREEIAEAGIELLRER